MDKDFLKIPTGELLEKFGAGNHKPGSGSAAALEGMLAAQLIQTVIRLTTDERRKGVYEAHIERFLKINSEIENRIYPALTKLFRQDSDEFDKVIEARAARDGETDIVRKFDLSEHARVALKAATKTPIEIGKLCVELARFAQDMLDNGFRSARGDSGVSLTAAVAAISGCISVVDLNLLSLPKDAWVDGIISELGQLKLHHQELSSSTAEKLRDLHREGAARRMLGEEVEKFTSIRPRIDASDSEVERIVQRLLGIIWKRKNKIWRENVPEDPIDMLDPKIVFKRILGYDFYQHTTLGRYEDVGGRFEVAGQIDQEKRSVAISDQFPRESRKFTAAHELGHALLHEQSVLHRDRAIDGSTLQGLRDPRERQADKFATYFLMPKRLTKERFRAIFLTEKFRITEESAFALNAGSAEAVRKQCGDLRGLARTLAMAKSYNGTQVYSLAEQFGVSELAMAIRLEELDLVEF